MVGFLPRFYSDELLYSFVARYHIYSLNQSPKYTSKDLFGHSMQLAVPDLPTNLKIMCSHLNTFVQTDVDRIINDHTFYNFYTNFIPLDKRNFVKKSMKSGEHKCAIHMTTGVMASGIKEKQYFYHCNECIEEDIKNHGETYWHLAHQLPGVYICLKHRTLLKKSSILFRSKERNVFCSAEEGSSLNPSLKINNQETFEKLRAVAEQCIILATRQLNFDLKELQRRYKMLLMRKRLATKKGTFVNQKELAKQFQFFYGDETLNILQSKVCYEESSCWLKEITRKHRKSFHPIRHILFILFMGETLKTIGDVYEKGFNPFGKGPYLCLNKAANHYNDFTIPNVEISVCSKTKRIIGTFRCECGFHYTRNDRDTEDLYKITRVKQFGELWINTVVDLIENKKMSYRSVAKQLNVDTKTIIKYANINNDGKSESNSEIDEMLKKKKFEWNALIKANPEKSVTELRSIHPALYSFLYRNDNEWLKENAPKKDRENDNQGKVDWTLRDILLKDEIKNAVNTILSYEPPVRITISSIGTEIGKRALLQKHLHKLPESCDTIHNCAEDIEMFQKRRIKYCIEKLKENEEEIKEWKLRRSAGLKMTINEDVITDLYK